MLLKMLQWVSHISANKQKHTTLDDLSLEFDLIRSTLFISRLTRQEGDKNGSAGGRGFSRSAFAPVGEKQFRLQENKTGKMVL